MQEPNLFEVIKQLAKLPEIESDPTIISTIKNPIEEIQLAAIKFADLPAILLRIRNISKAAKIAAVTKWCDGLKYIPDADSALNFLAVKNFSQAIRYVQRPSRKIQLSAIERDPLLIYYINEPCVEAELLAWKLGKRATNDPCKEVAKLLAEHKLMQKKIKDENIFEE